MAWGLSTALKHPIDHSMRSHFLVFVLAAALVAVSIIGCGKTEKPAVENNAPSLQIQMKAPEVTSMTLASKVDAVNNPANNTTAFSPMDTVWAITDVINLPAGAVIEAHWKYTTANEEINTNRVTVSEPGEQRLPFFIANREGWPVGEYQLTIAINGNVMKSQAFTVK